MAAGRAEAKKLHVSPKLSYLGDQTRGHEPPGGGISLSSLMSVGWWRSLVAQWVKDPVLLQ